MLRARTGQLLLLAYRSIDVACASSGVRTSAVSECSSSGRPFIESCFKQGCRGFAARAESAIVQESDAADDLTQFNTGSASVCEPLEFPFNAKAFYLGNKLDIYQLNAKADEKYYPHSTGRDSTILCMTPRRKGGLSETEEVTGLPLETFVVAFKYGAVVVFNPAAKDTAPKEKEVMEMCKPLIKNPVKKGFSEDIRISLRPDMEVWSSFDPDHIKLQTLDFNNIRTISHVLGQSVALDYYGRRVERMLEDFSEMNLEMQDSGDFTKVKKEQLLRMVAENNITLTDIIAKLGLFERYEIAWKYGQYGKIYEHLRDELEMENRYRILEMKLNFIQDNLKYFLEIMQNKKSDYMEWIIIVLIAMEVAIGLSDIARGMTS